MKNKGVLVVVALLVIVVGAYGAYRVYKHFKRLATAPAATTVEPTAPPAMSLKDILGLGTAEKCTYDQGTVYVAGGKVRGDFSVPENGVTTTSHMISMSNTSYIWTDSQKTGIKMAYNPNATPSASATSTSSAGVDMNKPMNYSCGAWAEDDSLFALPKGVTFQDVSSVVPSSGY